MTTSFAVLLVHIKRVIAGIDVLTYKKFVLLCIKLCNLSKIGCNPFFINTIHLYFNTEWFLIFRRNGRLEI